MKKNYLKKLQKTELEILDYFVDICEKNNLKYFIIYGTLLGAVRHKGFIPWDDDIDIAMFREDFDKFINIIKTEKNKKYILEYINTREDYYLPFAKIKNINTIYEEKNSTSYMGNKGIWIDIFPFDNFPTEKHSIISKIKGKIIMMMYAIMIRRTLHHKTSSHIKILSKILNNKQCIFITNKLSINKKNKKYIMHYCIEGLKYSAIFSKKDILPLQKIEFCGKYYYAPNNYKKVLKQIFGNDYMELPPVEKRTTHNPQKIVFEDGEKIIFE